MSDRATDTPRTRGPSGARPGATVRGGRKPGGGRAGVVAAPASPGRRQCPPSRGGRAPAGATGPCGPGAAGARGSAGPGGNGGIPAPPRLLSDGRQATPILPSDGLRDHSPALAEALGAHPSLFRPGIQRARYPLCTSGCRRPPWLLRLPRVWSHPVLAEMLWMLGAW